MPSSKRPKVIARLQNEIYNDLENALESHEKKMTYIGFAMLFVVLGIIMLAIWYEPIKSWLIS
jgi:NADH:ubiquinone oxidoreductase subunit 3 (subunit A)